MIKRYVSIDLETTGLHPRLDKIIEIGAVKVEQGLETDSFHTYVNPGRQLNEQISALTGIRDGQLAKAPDMDQVLPELLLFLEDLPLVGHRILFDYSFLKKAAVDRRIPFEKEGADTLKIARKYLGELEHRNLGYLCGYYNIPIIEHRALEDARATYLIYQKMWEEFGSGEEGLFKPSPLRFRVKRDTPATIPQKEQLYRLIGQHNIITDYDVEKLTRSEASRYTDKILAEYGRSPCC